MVREKTETESHLVATAKIREVTTFRTQTRWTKDKERRDTDGKTTGRDDDVAQNESHEGKRKCESVWPIFQITHQRSRYIYDLYYKRKAISKELYEFCLKEKYADRHLIAKWKKVSTYSLLAAQCGRND